jgi:hypothetical protein
MSAKISASRRAAFLKALGETGNLSLSAERAKVSRSWVLLHRKRDPEFDGACVAALHQARQSFDRLRTDGSTRPPAGWGHLDGVELVVRGTGGSGPGKRVQIARARLHQWDARVEERFLAALLATCNVKAACAEVGMTATSAYNHRKRWPAFAARWDAAEAEAEGRIEMALVEHGANLFSRRELPADIPIREMTAAQAIHLLHMRQHKLHGIGRAPGRRAGRS